MTPFAVFFMTVSMVSVTVLAGYCMLRILRGGTVYPDDDPSP